MRMLSCNAVYFKVEISSFTPMLAITLHYSYLQNFVALFPKLLHFDAVHTERHCLPGHF